MSRRTDKARLAIDIFKEAQIQTQQSGFGWEAAWQRNINFLDFSERDLLRESAWVILCSGFKESVVRAKFDYISLCFCDWESADEIIENKSACLLTAKSFFANDRKLEAIIKTAEIIASFGFSEIKARIIEEPISELKKFPYIGEITSWHLAKNLGLNVAKNDRHLAKMAEHCGLTNAHVLCKIISDATGELPHVVDVILWRFPTIFKQPYKAIYA